MSTVFSLGLWPTRKKPPSCARNRGNTKKTLKMWCGRISLFLLCILQNTRKQMASPTRRNADFSNPILWYTQKQWHKTHHHQLWKHIRRKKKTHFQNQRFSEKKTVCVCVCVCVWKRGEREIKSDRNATNKPSLIFCKAL